MNGIKYLLLSTVILMLLVFGLTSCTGDDAVNNNSGQEQDEINLSDENYETVDTPELPVDTSDPADADNTWAMFLINEQNPLPRRYDDVIETELVDETYREYYLDSRAAEYYKNMLEAAAEDGINLITVSAYRSYDYQKNNFDSNVEDRMSEGMSYAEAYKDSLASVQLPGQSEHNAGLAVDILSNEYNSMDDDGFENTEAFKWLDEHAAEYGFILRYPKGKTDITQIIYEPWHYRFVGIYYAKEIKESGLCMEEYFDKKGWLDEEGAATSHTIYDQNPDMELSHETYTTETVMGDDLPDEFREDSSDDEDTVTEEAEETDSVDEEQSEE
ncbi:MAG: M15 family metallopeptidase [Oscillospiraceae bacterium]|nr:M15 family metallopeptidase [Oscillospiraceae bacterium]